MSSAGEFPAPAEHAGTPEAALQLALDLTALDRAADLVAKLSPVLSRVEVGTPLALAAGLAAIDEVTWRGVLAAAADRGRGDGDPAPVVVDTVGGPPDPVALGVLAAAAAGAGVPVDLCLHRPRTGSPGFAELIRPLYGHRLPYGQLAVAGKLVPAEVWEFLISASRSHLASTADSRPSLLPKCRVSAAGVTPTSSAIRRSEPLVKP